MSGLGPVLMRRSRDWKMPWEVSEGIDPRVSRRSVSRKANESYIEQCWGAIPWIGHHETEPALLSSIVCKSNEVVPSESPLGLRKCNAFASTSKHFVLVRPCWPLHCVFLLKPEDKVVVFCELRPDFCKQFLSVGLVACVALSSCLSACAPSIHSRSYSSLASSACRWSSTR